MSRASLAVVACLLLQWGYAAGTACNVTVPAPSESDYVLPDTIPEVPFAKPITLIMTLFGAMTPVASAFESAIEIQITSLIMVSLWNCVASYHDSWNDGLRPGRPVIDSIPSSINISNGTDITTLNIHTSDARMLCFLQGLPTLFDTMVKAGVPVALGITAQFGIPASTTHAFDADIDACMDMANETESETCLKELVACHNYRPDIVGTIVMKHVLMYALEDGWNLDGSVGADGTPCTANCAPYSDTTGYFPDNYPGATKWWVQHKWRPLLEHDGLGYFIRQEHVVPHIGLTAVGRVMNRSEIDGRVAAHPSYDYSLEVDLVIQRLAHTAVNETLKMLIEFMDDKTWVARTVLGSLLMNFPQQMSIEDVALFFTGYLAGEHDSVVVVWKEKVRYDRVRTTTRVQDLDEDITTFAGPYQGVRTFKAKDFQPYIRVMPHSEYPSGSACICQAAYEYTEVWKQQFLQTNASLPLPLSFPAGSSKVEPGATPQADLSLMLPDMEALRDICGSTRLDGGMHFTASVPAGQALCAGIGQLAFNYAKGLVGDITSPIKMSR